MPLWKKINDRNLPSILCLCWLLAACGSNLSVPETVPQSLWGDVTPIAESEQPHAPTLVINDNQIFAAWTGADELEARLYASQLPDSQPTILALSALTPFSQHIYPALDDKFHMLWLDQDIESSEMRLFSALVQPNLIAELGANLISDQRVGQYATTQTDSNGLQIVWSGGQFDEPALYTQIIDGRGRFGFPVQIASNGIHPTILQTNAGIRYVFWLRGGGIYRAELYEEEVRNTQRIADALILQSGDLIAGFHASFDNTHGYLFWNINRADGNNETWYTSAQLNAPEWQAPEKLAIDLPNSDTVVETSYNSGRVDVAKLGSLPVTWAFPAKNSGETLPLTGIVDDELVILYWQSGAVVGYQSIAAAPRMLGEPYLFADRDRHLYLAWGELQASGLTQFFITSTRPN